MSKEKETAPEETWSPFSNTYSTITDGAFDQEPSSETDSMSFDRNLPTARICEISSNTIEIDLIEPSVDETHNDQTYQS